MIIKLDRESVCMGDDIVSHSIKKDLPENMLVSELLLYLTNYVPIVQNSVWAIVSLNSENNVIGFIDTNRKNKYQIEINVPDTPLKNLFTRDINNISIVCRYFCEGKFSWINGETGEHIIKFKECSTSLEKVKQELLINLTD